MNVTAGTVEIRSRVVRFLGGTITISPWAVLTFGSPFGGPTERLFSLPLIWGQGTAVITEDFTVQSPLTVFLGGGFWIQDFAVITLNALLINKGYLYLDRGTIDGPSVFWNKLNASTGAFSGGTLRVDTLNDGAFSLEGGNLILDGSSFVNYDNVFFHGGGCHHRGWQPHQLRQDYRIH